MWENTVRQQSQLRTLNKSLKQENVIEAPRAIINLTNKVLQLKMFVIITLTQTHTHTHNWHVLQIF